MVNNTALTMQIEETTGARTEVADFRQVDYIYESFCRAKGLDGSRSEFEPLIIRRNDMRIGTTLSDIIEIRGSFSKATVEKAILALKDNAELNSETLVEYHSNDIGSVDAIRFVKIKLHLK